MAISIYQQIREQPDLKQSKALILEALKGPTSWKILMVAVCAIVNMLMESFKWQILIKKVQPITFWHSVKATLSGQALSFTTINGLGESAGRALFLEEGNRLRGITMTLVGSMSLLIATFGIGLLSLVYLRFFILDATHHLEGLSVFWLNGLITVLSIGLSLFILLYYKLSWIIRLIEKIPFVSRYRFLIEKLENLDGKLLTKILCLSLIRYVVILVQYVLLVQVFDVGVNALDTVALVATMFLVLAMIPTIGLAELGFRGKISLQLFGLLSSNSIGIIATTAGVWIISAATPAIIGSVFLVGIRLFRNTKQD